MALWPRPNANPPTKPAKANQAASPQRSREETELVGLLLSSLVE